MKVHPIVFSEIKAKVGIDDVAFALGYRIDKKAGVGKYYELVLGDPARPSDKIIVRNTPDKASQFYFRRDGSKGDVVSLIRENINSFNVEGDNEWTRVANALAKLSNTPVPKNEESMYLQKSNVSSKVFDPSRYSVYPVNPDNLPYLLKYRGLSENCVRDFGMSLVLIRDNQNTKFQGFNIGFPYTDPETNALSGYEIRGSGGFKSKATGTDSAHSAWIAEFPAGNPQNVKNVYFFESAFDAMAFYQMNKARINNAPFAVVSVGGAFNVSLAERIIKRFPLAKSWDCFDNDLAGQLYSATLVKATDKTAFELDSKDDVVSLKFGDKTLQCPKDKFDFRLSAVTLGMQYSCGHWKSPNNYKDWNDCLLGKQIEPQFSQSKYQRDENLANQRKSTLKV